MNKGEREKLREVRLLLSDIARGLVDEPETPEIDALMTHLGKAHGLCSALLHKYIRSD